jgi:hypothetical protein
LPLKALNQEEASVHGTLCVIHQVWDGLLNFSAGSCSIVKRFMSGDWLSIRNIRLAKFEQQFEVNRYHSCNWLEDGSGLFHFGMNNVYCLYWTHIGHAKDGDTASLSAHNTILRRAKLDLKKPEYNKAWQLLLHSLTARILDIARYVGYAISYSLAHNLSRIKLRLKDVEDLRTWKPSFEALDTLSEEIVLEFCTTSAASSALRARDEILQHSILFNRDVLIFHQYMQAVRDGDVGRIWLIHSYWIWMMQGAGCTNYANELLELYAKFMYDMLPKLQEVIKRMWLVNRWGKDGRFIPIDLYLEHINGFIKVSTSDTIFVSLYLIFLQNYYAAHGSAASIDNIIEYASANVKVLRSITQHTTSWLRMGAVNRGKTEVDN